MNKICAGTIIRFVLLRITRFEIAELLEDNKDGIDDNFIRAIKLDRYKYDTK